jgi:DNA-binding transcriptional MerR regulator
VRISPESLISLMTPFKAADEAREERLAAAAEAKVRDAKAALEALSQRRSQASEERKAAARKKIEQLKARLEMLQSMAAVDPKGTARLAAQLARELGAAVKEYAAAGGSTSGLSAPAPAPSAPSAPAPADGQAQVPASVDGEAQAATDEGEPTPGGEDETKSANPYQQAIDEAQARAADYARRGAEAKADMEFLGEVRRMAAQIKALIRKAAEAQPGSDEALPPSEAQDARAAAAAMDRELAQASADLTGGGVSLLV